MHYKMAEILLDAYAHPEKPAVFYSANSVETGNRRLNAMPYWDWTPNRVQHAEGSCTHMFAVAFGCETFSPEENKEWIRKLITDPSQAFDLKIPDVWSGRTGRVLDRLAEKIRSLPPDDRVREPDIQSPLGIAELMWDQTFYFALLERPDAIHALLEKITQLVIAFIRAVHEVAGNRLVAAGFPCIWSDSHGTMLADDTMSLISPEMHREYSLPYVNRIADACGPLYYHSCTWREKYFDNIKRIRNVRTYNWNPGNSDDPALIMKTFAGRAVIALHLVKDMHLDKDVLALNRNFRDEVEYFAYILDSMPPNACMYWWLSNVIAKVDIIGRIYDLLHARGHSPQARGLA